jgi:ketosteroid isomerase-like protein
MKKILSFFFVITLLYACNNSAEKASTEATPATPTAEKSTVALPYTATFSTSFNQDLSDSAVLNVLNSYKAWETGDMTTLAATFTDTINFEGWDGTKYSGPKAGLLSKWAKSRDSISSIKVEFEVWMKNHEIDNKADVITVWYKEWDTYKSGKVDSAQWSDLNGVDKNGKIIWYRQYKRKL